MASSAHKTEEEKKEYFDTESELEKKCVELANLIKRSKHFVGFTGAGVSTSAGIADFRSGKETVLKTGPGCWEELAHGSGTKDVVSTPMQEAIPTFCHMSFVQLFNSGYLKFLISQNVDGLHRRSGIPIDRLAEVHGNTNLEKCSRCGKGYMRDTDVSDPFNYDVHCHLTGRNCDDPKCNGPLEDSIINFGENLPKWELREGFRQAESADLMLSVGSSLRVTPAADMPLATAKQKKSKLVIINLQRTPLDKRADICIHAMCDDVMRRVMHNLALDVPMFILQRYIKLGLLQGNKEDNLEKVTDKLGKVTEGLERLGLNEGEEEKEDGIKISTESYTLYIEGIDSDGSPYSLFSKVENITSKKVLKKEPYLIPLGENPKNIDIRLYFQGYYKEPPHTLSLDISKLIEKPLYCKLQYNPLRDAKWEPTFIETIPQK